VRDRRMRQKDIGEKVGQILQCWHRHLHQVIGLTGERISLLNLVDAPNQVQKALGATSSSRTKRRSIIPFARATTA
jgi:hypothetical protein